MPPFRRIAMFHIGRSGSSVLADMFFQHTDLVWGGEIYRRLIRKLDKSDLRMMRLPDPVVFVAEQFDDKAATNFGFEVKFFHLDLLGMPLARYVNELAQMGVDRFIVLRRNNYLRKVVSSLVAKETGVWHIRDNSNPRPAAVRVDVDDLRLDRQNGPLLTHLEKFDEDFRRLDTLLAGLPALKISYEEDVERDPLVAYRKIADFCGLATINPEVRLRKTNPYPLRDLITNYEEVRVYLAESDFAWMVE